MSTEALYQSLLDLSDTNLSTESFELNKASLLNELVLPKFPLAKYVNIEKLISETEVVLNISLFDIDGEQLGGAEITKTEIFWDDAI
jgi:hypothetical protein